MTEHRTFFNIITIPADQEGPAIEAWAAVGTYMETQPGFIGSTLYRNRRDPNTLINHGLYTDVESFMACVKSPEFGRLSQVLTDLGVTRVAGLYDQLRSFADGTPQLK